MYFDFGGSGFGGFGDDGDDEHGDYPGGSGEEEGPVDNHTYYDILELDNTASQDDIRKSYRKKVVKMHPDKGGDPEEFKLLSTAYEVLSEPEKRALYDQNGEKGLQENFSRMPNQNQKKKSKNILQELFVTLEDVYLGSTREIKVTRFRTCTTCKGNGSNKEGIDSKCYGCNGQGIKLMVMRTPFGMMQQQGYCPDCRGSGTNIKEEDQCPECKGDKVKKEDAALKVELDKGAGDGKRYIFRGESDEAPGVEPGDVIVEIAIEKHSRFLRKGADLVYAAQITLLEALTGFELELEHLDGRKIYIRTKPGEITRPVVLKTVKHCGMPFLENHVKYGNLYLSFNIKFPEKLEKEHLELLQKVLYSQIPIPSPEEQTETEKELEVAILNDYKEDDINSAYEGGKKGVNEEQEHPSHGGISCQGQ